MNKFHIELYPKADLENEWAKNKHTPGAMPCMRCGGPMRESLAENALSRALNVYVCPACGMDEALQDAARKVLPISEWYAVKQHRFAEHKKPQAVKLTPACAFTEIFSGARKTLPLSSARYPIPARTMTGGDGGQPGSRMKKCAQLRSLGRRSMPSSRSFSPCRNSKPCGRWSECAGCMPSRQMSLRNSTCTPKRLIFTSGSG